MHSLKFLLTGAFLPLVLAAFPTKPFHLRTQITPDEPFRYLTSDSVLSLTNHVGLTYDSESQTIKSTSSSDILYLRPNQAPRYSLELSNPQEHPDPSSLISPDWEFEDNHLIGSWLACRNSEGEDYSLYLDSPEDSESCTPVKLEVVYDHAEKDVEYITTSHVEFIKTGTWNTTITRTFTTHRSTGTEAPGGDHEDDCDIVTITSTKTDHTDCHCTSTGTAGTGSIGWSTSTLGYWNGTTTHTGGWESSTTAGASATGTGVVAVPTQPVEDMPIDSGAGSIIGSWKPAVVVGCVILGTLVVM